MDRAPRIFWGRAVAGSRWWSSARNAVLSSAPKRSGCATTSPPASTAIIFRRAKRFRSRSSARKVRSKMSALAAVGEASSYFVRLFALARTSLAQLVHKPSHSGRAQAARRLARHSLLITAAVGAAIIALMYALDAREIGLMPPRGTVGLWLVRILTDFGKDAYVLGSLAAALLAGAIISAALRGTSRARR